MIPASWSQPHNISTCPFGRGALTMEGFGDCAVACAPRNEVLPVAA
ncbi:hypothetical protein [Roseitranquillus sediminis]|nr:hypothetical protein [Roseitranquillus sediminis]MBM9595851.1 hypothetical protein [Roseitranquillus sediminis]